MCPYNYVTCLRFHIATWSIFSLYLPTHLSYLCTWPPIYLSPLPMPISYLYSCFAYLRFIGNFFPLYLPAYVPAYLPTCVPKYLCPPPTLANDISLPFPQSFCSQDLTLAFSSLPFPNLTFPSSLFPSFPISFFSYTFLSSLLLRASILLPVCFSLSFPSTFLLIPFSRPSS